MAFAGIDGVSALRQIQAANDQMSGDFLRRTRVMESIRANVYLSGTYLRDFLLEPDPVKDDAFRANVQAARTALDPSLREYQALLQSEEVAPFAALQSEMNGYWALIEPALRWSPEQRRRAGYAFLRDDVFSRRTSILSIIDQISVLATARLRAQKIHVAESYRQYLLGLTIAAALAIGLGFLLAAFSVRQIFALENEAATRYDEISHAREALKELSARLLAAQEDERRSVARELHDEVGQSLTGVLLEMGNLSTLIRNHRTEALEPKAAEIKKLMEDSITVVRNMALLLRPPMLDDLGLLPALQWHAREVARRSGLRVKIAAEGIPENLGEDVKTCIYRVVQEALHNVMRHAGASAVRVSLQLGEGQIHLSVQDDGKGFSTNGERGMGLLGVEERVTHLGGRFSVESEPGQGAILRVSLPVAG